ncbi:MAG: 2TM domain-containing protein [Gammaproteobacteria bacterium]|nr:2TM domain-containing protein [Gammaproteobacteria bacterium]
MTEQLQQEAQHYVTKLRRFYKSLWTYIIVNAILVVINLTTSPNHLWVYWVAIIWGIFIIIQAFFTFGPGTQLSKSWEAKKISEYIAKRNDPSNKK